jgi:hypothetical protein
MLALGGCALALSLDDFGPECEGGCCDGSCCSGCEGACVQCNAATATCEALPIGVADAARGCAAPGRCDGNGRCVEGEIEWGFALGDPERQELYGVAADEDGFTLAGMIEGAPAFGAMPLGAVGQDGVVARLDPQGKPLWARVLGGTGNDYAIAVAATPDGGAAVTGEFGIDIVLAGQAYASLDGLDIFLVRFDATGQQVWGHAFTSSMPAPGADAGYAAAADADGVVIAGLVAGGATFDEGTTFVGGIGSADAFVAAFDDAGAHRWSLGFGSLGSDAISGVALDAQGDALVAGWVEGEATFPGGEPLAYAGAFDAVVAKVGADGTHRWSRTFGGPGDDRAYAVAVDASGSIYVTGWFTGSIGFDGVALQAPTVDSVDAYVVELDPDGNARWARALGSPGANGYGIAVDEFSQVVVGGLATGRIDFGDGASIIEPGVVAAFVAKYGPAGQPLWGRRFDRGGTQSLSGVAVTSAGIAASGRFDTAVDFPADVQLTEGGFDGFAVFLSP